MKRRIQGIHFQSAEKWLESKIEFQFMPIHGPMYFAAKPSRVAKTVPKILAYGAQAIANGSEMVTVEGKAGLTGVRPGDRFEIRTESLVMVFRIVSIDDASGQIRVDRQMARGCYPWSISRKPPVDRDIDNAKISMVSIDRPDPSTILVPGFQRNQCWSLDLQTEEYEIGTVWQADRIVIPDQRTNLAHVPSPLNRLSEWLLEPRRRPTRPKRRREKGASASPSTPGIRFTGIERIERHATYDPCLSSPVEHAEHAKATLAFWVYRKSRVVRPELLMVARDAARGNEFVVMLRPNDQGTDPWETGVNYVIEVTPKTGRDARPARWTVRQDNRGDQWQFVAIATDGTDGVSLWIDGRPLGRQRSTPGIANFDSISIGGAALQQGHTSREVSMSKYVWTARPLRDTSLAGLAIWDRQLSVPELTRAMSLSPTCATTDGTLQLDWRFRSAPYPTVDENRIITDHSGTQRHGQRTTCGS